MEVIISCPPDGLSQSPRHMHTQRLATELRSHGDGRDGERAGSISVCPRTPNPLFSRNSMSARPCRYAIVRPYILDRRWTGSTNMARHVRNPKIESRAARAKLRPSAKPTYFDLGGKLHLGYRRGKGAGRWVMRVYLGGEKYTTETLGEADDLADANGTSVLNFDQAQRMARERMKALEARSNGSAVTVSNAIETYLAAHSASPGARSKLKHVLEDGALSKTPLAALTADDLARWRERLGKTMADLSVRRVANDFRAALNAAGKRQRGELPSTFRDTVRDGLAAPRGATGGGAREKQVLADADVRRIISAAWDIDAEGDWDGDLGRMVTVLAATGQR